VYVYKSLKHYNSIYIKHFTLFILLEWQNIQVMQTILHPTFSILCTSTLRPKWLLNLHSQISDSFHITEHRTGNNYSWNGLLFQYMDRSQILLNWCLMWMVKQDCDSMCNLPGMFQAGRIINNMPKIHVQSIYLLLVTIPEVFNKISPKKYTCS